MQKLTISVIIDNYNYGVFLPQAIDSVLAQTYSDFELVIVDDGSTDDSRQIIEKYALDDVRIKPVFKTNGGQASAFNAGFEACVGDVICFLDSDDYFAPTKLEEIAALHCEGYDYIHTDHKPVWRDGQDGSDNIKRFRYDGQCAFLVYYMSKYPGNVTSTISISRKLANDIFPLPYENEWRIQADDCIVFQASMIARARYMDRKLTYYRIHEANGHYGKKRSPDYVYELLKKRNKIKELIISKGFITKTFLHNGYNLVQEFKTHTFLDLEILKLYCRVVWFEINMPFLKKIQATIDLVKFYNNRKG